ncbi:MAG: UDP-N-acetylmuramoyl-tripeptide--D-alanyl-D-alanine ligase [Bacteroidota bacterium]
MIIKQFLDLIERIGEFETDKMKLYLRDRCSLDEMVFITTDSRKIKKNSIFIAIKGKNVNGHDYINESFDKGAILSIIEDAGDYNGLCIKVDHVVQFINKMASYLYKQYAGFTIAITGSNGKTTTKEWIKRLLSTFINQESIFANSENMNTEIGLPLCILNDLTTQKKYSVIEMGMSKKGDIEYLVDTYKPDFPVILNIGTAHIGNTGSLDNTFREKVKLMKHHSNDEPFCLNCSDSLLRQYLKKCQKQKPILFGQINDEIEDFSGVFLENYRHYFQGQQFYTSFKLAIRCQGKNEQLENRLNGLFHKGQLLNVCAALAVVSSLGYAVDSLPDLSRVIGSIKDRFEPVFIRNHLFIKDCYNSSLESLRYALELLKKLKEDKKFKKIICVLGSIAETGPFEAEIHEKIGHFLNENRVDNVFLYTKDSGIKQIQKKYKGKVLSFSDVTALSMEIKQRIQTKQNTVFLFKASRSIQLEEVFDHVMDVIN